MSRADFWACTPTELGYRSAGYRLERKRDKELVAWQTAHLMNCHIKRSISAADLLRSDDGGVQLIDPELIRIEGETIEKEWDRRMRIFNKRRILKGEPEFDIAG